MSNNSTISTWLSQYQCSVRLQSLKTRLANDAKGKGGERQFNGLIDVYVKTLKSDGIQGLYRGFTISAVGIFIYRGMYFGLYDTLKPLLLGKDAGVFLSFFLGWAVTVTAGLMSYPIGETSYFSLTHLDLKLPCHNPQNECP